LYESLTTEKKGLSLMIGTPFRPIRSLWGHTAGATSNPADAKFLNETIGSSLGR
jgi:homoserine O-acetyltransferase